MVRFLISTTEELREELKSAADEQGQTLNGLVRQILWDWAKKADLVKQTEGKEEPR